MFNTHWSIIPMSFFPAGIACGFLGIGPEGMMFTVMLLFFFWQHIAIYFVCRFFLELELGKFPKKELLIALGCFVAGYVLANGQYDFMIFCISLLASGTFFVHDFIFGVALLVIRLMPQEKFDWESLRFPESRLLYV